MSSDDLTAIKSLVADVLRNQKHLQEQIAELSRTAYPTSVPVSPTSGTPIVADLARADPVSLSPPASPSLAPKNDAAGYSSRVILTTYPGQVGINPVQMQWYNPDPAQRGPIIASRHANSIKRRNAVGAYSGGYSIYRALASAMGTVDPNFVPSYENTEPAFHVPYNETWSTPGKIVALDPWGHLAPTIWHKEFESGLDIRPTIAVTKAHLKVSELDEAVRAGRLSVDGKIVVKSQSLNNSGLPGVEVNVGKCAVEPVWYLPGVADRFGITEQHLRRALFEHSGGMYPELLTRPDIKLFLPPIGGLSVYIFGNPAHLSNPEKELALRIHDECNGSDVFGSDICTCRPYLLYGIEEAIKCAQRGGVGVVIYFRKEGRSLGEVTKYLVYNARKRGGDSASTYFKRTEDIAGVKDMRFQVLSTDILHWLGIKKIDKMLSMSDMKYNAIVESGIPILERYDLPNDWIPEDSQVEIDAKIAAGHFSSTKHVTDDDLAATVGRAWEKWQWDDISH